MCIYYMLCSDILKYNSDLYSDIFTLKLSEYNFTVGGRIKYVSLTNGIFIGYILNYDLNLLDHRKIFKNFIIEYN